MTRLQCHFSGEAHLIFETRLLRPINACQGKKHYMGGALRAHMEAEYPEADKAPRKRRSKGAAAGAEASEPDAKKGKW